MKKVSMKKVSNMLKESDRTLIRISRRWRKTFWKDPAIDQDDLCQEIREKVFVSLLSNPFDSNKASLRTYVTKIATNHLINMIRRNNAKLKRVSSFEDIFSKTNDINMLLIETIDSLEVDGDFILAEKHLFKKIRKDLNKQVYKPDRFIKRLRSFSLKLFDTLYYNKENFVDFATFHWNCHRRAQGNNGFRIRKNIVPTYKILSMYLNVNVRSVEIGMRIIKKVIMKNVTEGLKK